MVGSLAIQDLKEFLDIHELLSLICFIEMFCWRLSHLDVYDRLSATPNCINLVPGIF